jgi:hypothetical protein
MKLACCSLALGASAVGLMLGCSDAAQVAPQDEAMAQAPMEEAIAPDARATPGMEGWGAGRSGLPGGGFDRDDVGGHRGDRDFDRDNVGVHHGDRDFDRNDFFRRGFGGFNVDDCRWGGCGWRGW